MHQPDGLLTLGSEHDVGLNPHIIAPDPYASAECLDVSTSPGLILLTTSTMGDDDPPSGRLRPRKSLVRNLQIKSSSTSESQVPPDKQRRTSTPSKALPNKHNDLVNKSEFSQTPQFLCPYCDKKFVSKQTVSKHTRRMHPAVSKQASSNACIFCNHTETSGTTIIRHMVECHPNQYFACLNCNTRFPSTTELAQHKLNVCEKQKVSYRNKLRHKVAQGIKKKKKSLKVKESHSKSEIPSQEHSFNGIVISCELKPSLEHNAEDIEDNITTNLILPPSKNLGSSSALEKSAVIILDDIQWNKRIPPNFTFHNTDADQILSRLGVVHKSPRTGDSAKKDSFKSIDESSLRFEKCFDTTFYSKVSSNVQENLSKFLDGTFNFNPDPESVIKTRKSKKSVVINTAEGFPILLACEQYSRSIYDGYMPRSLAPRHKWIRDIIETERSLMNPDQIKRDSHVNNCIITLVSGLDIWTQLCMRRKFEDKNRSQAPEKKLEKRTNVRKELEDILESRELPSTSQLDKPKDKLIQPGQALDFPASLGLVPSAPSYEMQPAVLSGEWVRPRCYVCCACGAQTRDPRTLTTHIVTRHPNAQVQHYEIVGEVLLNADILKHLYVPSSQTLNRTRPLRGFRECTKCMKSISLEDLHQHMLDCAGDTPAVRRRQCRHRPFGVRRRRPRLADNTVRKKIRKDIRTRQRRQKNMIRPRQKIRTEVGDAETIRKMLADLPAKRHRILVNPLNHTTRPRVKRDNQNKKIMMKKNSLDEKTVKGASGSKSSTRTMKLEGSVSRSVALNSNTNDDTKSLRSKRRVVVKTPRQSQSVQRNANMSRIKRKSIRLKEQMLGNKDVGATQDLQSELTIDDSVQKMDIKKTGYKTREHANETGSNNCSENRQDCSRSNSNSNNSVAPTQSVPLKHSIASLTANSETHDKSVQFHHLFLVQQECNNVNQHTPSGERTLFENDDVIVKLDKPPLHLCKTSLDLQKNKVNKPRKGLNDCIAMLKHKLLDPMPSEAAGHVSVQCGGDEPLDFNLPITKHSTMDANETVRDNPSPNNHIKLSQNNIQQSDTSITIKETFEENENSVCLEKETVKNKVNDTESVRNSPKLVSEKQNITQRPNSPHKTVPALCTESNTAPVNPDSGSNYALSTKDESNSLNTVNSNSYDNSSQISVRYLEYETTSKKGIFSSVNHECALPLQKDNLEKTETDLIDNLQVDISSQPKELKNIPTVIPPAHASTNVVPMLTIPLDLSSNNQITSQKTCYSMDTYDYYETLDLSNKTSYGSKSVNSYGVVDLRVKPLHAEYQHSVNLCIKSTIDNTQNLKDPSENTPTDLSVKGKSTDTRHDKYDMMPLIQNLSNHRKIIQECRYNPYVVASQNCPTDLSGKTPGHSASKIDQCNIDTGDMEHSEYLQNPVNKVNDAMSESNFKISPQTVMLPSEATIGQNENRCSDCIPSSKQNLETVHCNSNNCDSALVIPHYKMKATTTIQEKVQMKKFFSESLEEYSCLSNNIPNVITSPAPIGSPAEMTVNISTKPRDILGDTSNISTMDIISKSMTATTVSYLSTQVTGLNVMPLYTTSSDFSTDTSVSKPTFSSSQSTNGTTVVSSTSIYATSAEIPSTPKTQLEQKDIADLQKYERNKPGQDSVTEVETKLDNQKDSSVVVVTYDQDPETAKKIAMLPKELVEIIGNMPADHRKQLLNVLPQYVSTSAASSQNESEKMISLESLATGTSQTESFENEELSSHKTCSLTSQENISKQKLASPKCPDQIPQLKLSHTVQPFSFCPANDTSKRSLFNTESDFKLEDEIKVDKDHGLEDPYMVLVSNKINEYDNNREKIIDLTDEESPVLSIDTVKAVENLSNAVKLCTPNVTTLTSMEKPLKRKVNSEKTASLRAVRIKAPAERQKESKLLKRMSVQQQCKPNISDSEENEVNKALESYTSLAIQQAEISSTQSNKNVLSIANNEPEPNGHDAHHPLHSRIGTLVENKNNNSHESITKISVVTSSIPVSDATREDSNDTSLKKTLSTEALDKESTDNNLKISKKEDLNITNIDSNILIDAVEVEPLKKSTKLIKEISNQSSVQSHTEKKKEKSDRITAILDDDSEDDVSLASIVKQKKDSKKCGHDIDILQNVTNASVANNDQHLDNNALLPSVNACNKIIKKNKRTRKLKKSVCDSRVLAETANVVNQRSKYKKRNNKVEPATPEKSDTIKDDKVKDILPCEDFKMKIANKESDLVNTSEQENKNVTLVDQDKTMPKSNISKDKTGTVKLSMKKVSRKSSITDNTLSNAEDDILSSVHKENMNNSVCQTKKTNKSEFEGKHDDLCAIEQRNENVSTELSTSNTEKNEKWASQSKNVLNVEECQSQLEGQSDKNVKLTNDLKSTEKEVLKDNSEIDANISTSLRRSRRGKSLYMEKIADSLIIETDLDHKIPLTKKQLIFSKLLLDEESFGKQVENNDKNKYNESTVSNEDTVVHSKEEKICSSDLAIDISIDKGKKRKKTSQIKGKNKKKKPFDVNQGQKNDDEFITKDVTDTASAPNEENQSNILNKVNIQETICESEKDKSKELKPASEYDNNQKDITKNLTEKRKFDMLTNCDDGPVINKKTKLHLEPGSEIVEMNKELNTTSKDKIPLSTNTLVAARRTRSKSVFVKSSPQNLYDPYDIDFDDIGENAEPFRKASKQTKAFHKNQASQIVGSDLKQNEKELSTVHNSRMTYSTKVQKRAASKLKADLFPVSSKYYNIFEENSINSDTQHSKSKQGSPVVANQSKNVNEDLSDSDDSSKSDVPLQKYLEGKEKRIIEEDNTSSDTKLNKKAYTQKNTDTGAVSETEEQLRSEKFMQSFGFFSERKPRKSNLLAAKKIAETFNNIANEKDDNLYGPKHRIPKKVCPNENKKNLLNPIHKAVNKIRKPKSPKNDNEAEPSYCDVCRKAFFRPDNYLRHQMTLLHISKLSEFEMKLPTNRIIEEPNYLVAFRDQIERLKEIGKKLAETKKTKIKFPSLDIIVQKVNVIVEKQKLKMRGLSNDQELFLDCCELLKESHMPELTKQESIRLVNEKHHNSCSNQASLSDIEIMEKINNDVNSDSKSECDSITAKSILESEEVRNLENDLISGLKEAAKINRRIAKNIRAHQDETEISNESFSISNTEDRQMQVDQFDSEELELNKSKKHIQIKAKMYPDVEDIDIFEDKFDKIKRKCRSQAAAAKQTQSILEASPGHKTRKKIERKKGRRALKKNYQNTVLTKGALKGFDGIKVSIPTSEINVPGINLSLEVPSKKKKRKFSKKKREKKDSESSSKFENDSRIREGSSSQKKLDVYEFMDNEDAELFEFRPSTLMERFKSMNSKEYHSKETSKLNVSVDEVENSSESGSDEDDFVYMSDDYVCSDDETENSLLSCEITNLKAESRKNFTPPKRKDVVEKNAVMGKIFKHNAVRNDKKGIKTKEPDKLKTNLDQLFDSLLEDEPVTSTIDNEETSAYISETQILPNKKTGSLHTDDVSLENKATSLKDHDTPYLTEWNGPSTSKQGEYDLLGDPNLSKSYVVALKKSVNSSMLKCSKNYIDSKDESLDDTSTIKELQDDFCNEVFDDTGVARQRARRKCTVGKQNVLAETWSSESEPDAVPLRSNSAESLVNTTSRKKKGKKRDSNLSSGRRGNRSLSNKKQDVQSKVNSTCRKITSSSATSNFALENQVEIATEARELENKIQDPVDILQPSDCTTPNAVPAAQGPLTVKGQPRSATSYWSPGGPTEQEHIQQHGWIVGDSHKKLVTMLAHAKGRKRHNDDERHLIE